MRVLSLVCALVIGSFSQAAGPSAYESACQSARECRMAHRGGSYSAEGVGFSTRSAADALRNCCFYGRRRIVEKAVVRGANGWYACVRYR